MNPRSSRVSFASCPLPGCPTALNPSAGSPACGRFVRNGGYWRADDSRWIDRWLCRDCRRSFSSARKSDCFGQKKRRINPQVEKLYYSGVSLNRIALLLGLDRKTVVRKFLFLAAQAKKERLQSLKALAQQKEKIGALHFDELESFERSKCLPLSIPLAVVPGCRKILAFRVGRMPAKGPLAALSRMKYGPRPDERASLADSLFAEIGPLLDPKVQITTDQNPKYPGWIKKRLPQARHKKVKGRRGCGVGQGELKKIGFDPLFDLNHTAAMLRANINRLFRRTWCTTKRMERLEAHIELYVRFHNRVLTPKEWFESRAA
jgi:transposase-like protein